MVTSTVMNPAVPTSDLGERGQQAIERVSSGAHEAVDRVASIAKSATNRAGEINQQMMGAKDEWIGIARDYVREHPVAAIGIAVSVGYLLSRLTGR